MLCDDPEVWGGGVGGRLKGEGIYVYIQLIHIIVQQKLIQHLKQLFLKKKKKNGKLHSTSLKYLHK